MDDNDSDDELIICTFHLMTTIINQKHKLSDERGQKRKIQERDWTAKRTEPGAYHGLVARCERVQTNAPTHFFDSPGGAVNVLALAIVFDASDRSMFFSVL